MAAAIETQKLTKTYRSRSLGKVNVVDELDLVVEEGEIFGFLGPNGAGKTTTIKMLLGIIAPTSGEGYVLGREIGDMDVHKVISYLPERPYYYEYMTGMELLRFYGSLFGIKDTAKFQGLLEKVNLAGDATKTISLYSKVISSRLDSPKACSTTRSSCSSTSRPAVSTRLHIRKFVISFFNSAMRVERCSSRATS